MDADSAHRKQSSHAHHRHAGSVARHGSNGAHDKAHIQNHGPWKHRAASRGPTRAGSGAARLQHAQHHHSWWQQRKRPHNSGDVAAHTEGRKSENKDIDRSPHKAMQELIKTEETDHQVLLPLTTSNATAPSQPALGLNTGTEHQKVLQQLATQGTEQQQQQLLLLPPSASGSSSSTKPSPQASGSGSSNQGTSAPDPSKATMPTEQQPDHGQGTQGASSGEQAPAAASQDHMALIGKAIKVVRSDDSKTARRVAQQQGSTPLSWGEESFASLGSFASQLAGHAPSYRRVSSEEEIIAALESSYDPAVYAASQRGRVVDSEATRVAPERAGRLHADDAALDGDRHEGGHATDFQEREHEYYAHLRREEVSAVRDEFNKQQGNLLYNLMGLDGMQAATANKH